MDCISSLSYLLRHVEESEFGACVVWSVSIFCSTQTPRRSHCFDLSNDFDTACLTAKCFASSHCFSPKVARSSLSLSSKIVSTPPLLLTNPNKKNFSDNTTPPRYGDVLTESGMLVRGKDWREMNASRRRGLDEGKESSSSPSTAVSTR